MEVITPAFSSAVAHYNRLVQELLYLMTREDRRTWCYPGRGTLRNLHEPRTPPAVSRRPPTGEGTGSSLAAPANAIAELEAQLDRSSISKNASITSAPGTRSEALCTRKQET